MGKILKVFKRNKQKTMDKDNATRNLFSNLFKNITPSVIDMVIKLDYLPGSIFNGTIKGFRATPMSNFDPVTAYKDAEYNQELMTEAVNISNLRTAVKTALYKSDTEEVKKQLSVMKNKMDYLLNKYPRIFISYGIWGAIYYNFMGILYKTKGNIKKAKENHIRGLIYETIYLVSSINVNTFDKINKWSQKKLANLYNYNLLVDDDKKISTPVEVISCEELAMLLANYLLTIISHVDFSRIGAFAYLTHIHNLLTIYYGEQEYKKQFGNKITEVLSNIRAEYSKLTIAEVEMIKGLLLHLQQSIKSDCNIESAVNRFMAR